MNTIERTDLWKTSLGASYADKSTSDFVESLRTSFRDARNKSELIASELSQHLRQLTVHDMSHIDALWEVFDVVFPTAAIANPVEAYVLGCAFLFHDLGHALSSYPGTLEELKKTDAWMIATSRLGRDSTESAIIDEALRLNHAQHAKRLGVLTFGENLYLISNDVLRQHLGNCIGEIAFSHWWSHQVLEHSHLRVQLGAVPVPECPIGWTIDRMKLAYVLRVCDACQIDGRRAPAFLQSLRKPTGIAKGHWVAQQMTSKPISENGTLKFTTTFEASELDREGWWTAFDLVRNADFEIRAAFDYFEANSWEMKVRRVAGVQSPRAFAQYFRVKGWIPVDAAPKITSIASLISNIGGMGLYGPDFTVPLRELIQNSRDAVVFRRKLEGRSSDWGSIEVSLKGRELFVRDTGIGMSEQTILNFLVDFGQSYWKSSTFVEDYPNSSSLDFAPVGRFGIGFFSVFMLGDNIKIITRRPEDGTNQTRVLEFHSNLTHRPVLREASPEERQIEPGTIVSIQLKQEAVNQLLKVHIPELFFRRPLKLRDTWTIQDLLQWLCPTLDVDLIVNQGKPKRVVEANDWMRMPADRLLRRVNLHIEDWGVVASHPEFGYHCNCMHLANSSNGLPIARVSYTDTHSLITSGLRLEGVVSCGGFRSRSELNFPGVLLGSPVSAARFDASPFFFEDSVAKTNWANNVAKNLNFQDLSFSHVIRIAAIIRLSGGDATNIPFSIHGGIPKSYRELVLSLRDHSYNLVRLFPCDVTKGSYDDLTTYYGYDARNPTHVGIPMGRMRPIELNPEENDPKARSTNDVWRQYWYSCWGLAIEAVAESWECSIDDLLNVSKIAVAQNAFMTSATLIRPA